MTKEELEKEAEEYANNLLFVYETDIVQRIVRERVKLALIDVLEPREKEIKSLGERCLQLQKDKGNLTDKVADLEAQIEKMKSDVLSLIKDRMNDDIDQNIIERLADKWGLKYE